MYNMCLNVSIVIRCESCLSQFVKCVEYKEAQRVHWACIHTEDAPIAYIYSEIIYVREKNQLKNMVQVYSFTVGLLYSIYYCTLRTMFLKYLPTG